MNTLWQDLRYGARMLLKNPGFTVVAVLALALGIGANSAIFSVVNALLLRPLPFKEPDKLVQVWEANVKRGHNTMSASYPNFADWRNQNQVFEQIAAYSDQTFNLTSAAEPERIQGAIISPAFFPLLGIKPILGRVFLPEEDHPNKVFSVVMSERLWRRRFNADPQIIGQTIRLDSESFTVVGVVAFGPADLPRAREIAVDGRVFGFTLAVSLLTGIIFGFVPALQASRLDLNETLKESGRSATGSAGHRRLRSLLVVSEIALSLVLLVGAGLLMRSFLKLQAVNPGFNPNNVLTMKVSLQGPNYQKAEPIIAFHDQLLEKIKALPGVQSVATRYHIPLAPDDGYANLSFAIEGRLPDPANRPTAFYNAVSPDYFHTLEIPVLKGRPFDEHDVMKARSVIIINETLARRYFPGEDPIGKRMTLGDQNPKEADWAAIVGVVKDTKPRTLASNPAAEMYMPFAQQSERTMALMIRTTNKPENLTAAVRREVQALDRNQPVHSVRTLESVLSAAVATPRFRTSLLGVIAVVALILALVGIYGVMSYAVTQRTHEIGIRLALGAQTSDVLKLVVGQGMALAFAGVALGLGASFALTRVMSKLLFDVSPTDPLTFAVIALLLTGVALAACYVPARRAMKVDPLVALRCE